ncbi:uncharacterized protein N7515_003886 [Penicillium bovifimosum]|uniref:Integrase zinc-binding domain-containing protein n=1 Tax=Penicillium bovifimosum TaxID=126998 RepID=A0A9W9H5Q1_9EURO|nr:uncharacterized protein N7515_003886 [Penicillium bovifimosum]KAJ5139038.1 hypothetical protein N7515_003886 [Penicillium bovifimosum]
MIWVERQYHSVLHKGIKWLWGATFPFPYDHYTVQGIVLFKERYYIPSGEKLKSEILRLQHDDPITGGHFRRARTVDMVSRKYYWRNIHDEVKEYLKSTVIAQNGAFTNGETTLSSGCRSTCLFASEDRRARPDMAEDSPANMSQDRPLWNARVATMTLVRGVPEDDWLAATIQFLDDGTELADKNIARAVKEFAAKLSFRLAPVPGRRSPEANRQVGLHP